ncbi:MAG: hypothetical protein IJA63_01965, partial [Akkermansia sp.]|nr:hypothetical protein [Akkermansia sp.]
MTVRTTKINVGVFQLNYTPVFNKNIAIRGRGNKRICYFLVLRSQASVGSYITPLLIDTYTF